VREGSPVELTAYFYYDPESRNWGFRVPALSIVGGGQQTREDAVQAALEAIAFTLKPACQVIDDAPEDATIEHFRVTVERPAMAGKAAVR
jgi:predicted RNase H-like HicB family nuclease